MKTEKITEELYNKIVQSHPKRKFPIEQSPLWGAFQSRIPGRHDLGQFLLSTDEQQIALVSPLQLTMRGYTYVWVNQGPTWLVPPTPELCNQVAEVLKTLVKQAQHNSRLVFVRAHFPTQPRGAFPAYSKSLIAKTTAIDLTQPFDDILAAMHQGARRSMRKAQKAGVTVQEVSATEAAANFDPYYAILTETASRDGFFVHPASTYKTMLESLPEVVRFFVAFLDGQPVAWAIDTAYLGHGIYYYGASNQKGRAAEAPYLLHIAIMQQFQTEGIKSYDFLGIGSESYPGLQGVTQFKLKFGGPEIAYVPSYDLPVSAHYHPWKWAQTLKYKLR